MIPKPADSCGITRHRGSRNLASGQKSVRNSAKLSRNATLPAYLRISTHRTRASTGERGQRRGCAMKTGLKSADSGPHVRQRDSVDKRFSDPRPAETMYTRLASTQRPCARRRSSPSRSTVSRGRSRNGGVADHLHGRQLASLRVASIRRRRHGVSPMRRHIGCEVVLLETTPRLPARTSRRWASYASAAAGFGWTGAAFQRRIGLALTAAAYVSPAGVMSANAATSSAMVATM